MPLFPARKRFGSKRNWFLVFYWRFKFLGVDMGRIFAILRRLRLSWGEGRNGLTLGAGFW
jgi:hypothetical protein